MEDNGTNVATIIPYKKFKEKVRIVNEELKKGRKVEVDERNVYSYRKEREDE